MKILSLLLIACAFSFTASAQSMQDTTHHRKHNGYSQSANHQWYTFKDGSLMMNNKGTMTPVTSDVTLSNGTTISTSGKVTWKNGKSQTLENGEMVDGNGKIHKGRKNKMSSEK
jgi:hypothetical protein